MVRVILTQVCCQQDDQKNRNSSRMKSDASMRATSAPVSAMHLDVNSWCLCSSMDYSPQELSRGMELLSSLMMLQPLLSGLAEELLSVSLELNIERLLEVMGQLQTAGEDRGKRKRSIIHVSVHAQTSILLHWQHHAQIWWVKDLA